MVLCIALRMAGGESASLTWLDLIQVSELMPEVGFLHLNLMH